MITEDQMMALPEDLEQAFVAFEKIIREKLYEHNREHNPSSWDAEREYINHVLAFISINNIDFIHLEEPPESEEELYNYLKSIQRKIDYVSTKIKIENVKRVRSGVKTIVHIDADTRGKIHNYLQRIRDTLNEIEMTDKKREAIFSKLNALAEEVDRDRTRSDALMSLILEVSDTGSAAAKKLAPVKELADSITKLFAKAKEVTEKIGLPKPQEMKRIEGPKNYIDSRPVALDEEIPF